MKEANKNKVLRHVKIIVLTGLLLFTLSWTVYAAGCIFFGTLGHTGIINDKNRCFMWIIIIFTLFLLAGAFVDYLLRQILTKKHQKLFSAMQKLSDGELSVRLEGGTRITDTGALTVSTFNNMASQLQATDTLNRNFAGTFSHEIKNPVGTISGFAKILKDANLSESKKKEYLDIIIQETEQLGRLSGSILLLSRLEATDKIGNKLEYDLTEQLRQTVASVYPELKKKQLDISLTEVQTSITAEPSLMAHVWLNIISNAMKFSPENGKITVDITKNADCTSVSIKNYGCTLKEYEVPRIFEKFYRGEESTDLNGSGLGLSIVRKIVSLHGGECAVSVTDGGEFTITVSIPCQ